VRAGRKYQTEAGREANSASGRVSLITRQQTFPGRLTSQNSTPGQVRRQQLHRRRPPRGRDIITALCKMITGNPRGAPVILSPLTGAINSCRPVSPSGAGESASSRIGYSLDSYGRGGCGD